MEEIIYVWSDSQKALVDGLIADRDAAQAELAKLRAEVAECNWTKVALAYVTSELAQLREELGRCNDLCAIEDGGGAVSDVLARKITNLRAELAAANGELDTANKHIDALRGSWQNAEHARNAAQAELAQLRDTINTLESENKILKNANIILKEACEIAENDRKEWGELYHKTLDKYNAWKDYTNHIESCRVCMELEKRCAEQLKLRNIILEVENERFA